MGYNHYYLEVFGDSDPEKIKNDERWAEELGRSSQYPISSCIVIDMDNDGEDEKIVSVYTGREKYPDLLKKGAVVVYDVMYYEEDDTERLFDTFGTPGTVLSLFVGRFGKNKVLIEAAGDDEGHPDYSSVFIFDGERIVVPDALSKGKTVKSDSDGNIYFLSYGGDWGPLLKENWYPIYQSPTQKYYLTYVDGTLMEYDSVEITKEDFLRLNGAEEALSDSVESMRDRNIGLPFPVAGEYECEIRNILYSGNDRVYVNYLVKLNDTDYNDPQNKFMKSELIRYWVSVFEIENGAVRYLEYEFHERFLRSGEDIESYTVEYPY